MKKSSTKYAPLPNEDNSALTKTSTIGESGIVLTGLFGPGNLSKTEEGVSYESIFTYSAPAGAHSDGFAEYWRPTEYCVINEPRRDDGGTFDSLLNLFLNPPFATAKPKSANRSAIITSSESITNTAITIGRHAVWAFLFIVFSFIWLLLFPFHWYWTLSRVRLNEAVVIFRVGQAPMVRKKTGSLICIWPFLDRCHRVNLSRRGFSVPPTQIGLNDGSVVRLGAELSFHITDPLRFVRMSSDTVTSIRHVVHGQFVSYLSGQPLDNLQKYSGGVQTELRSHCFRQLSQFGVFVDTFTLSQLEVIRQPIDPGQEFIKTVLNAIGASSGSANPLSSIISAAMPFGPPGTIPPQETAPVATPAKQSEQSSLSATSSSNISAVDKAIGMRITEFLSNSLRQISPEKLSSLGLQPDSMFRLILGKHDSWLLFPYTGHVDGPVPPPQKGEHGIAGYKEKGTLYVADWETLESLRDGKISPLVATMSGLLHISGDAAALAKLFDPSNMQTI